MNFSCSYVQLEYTPLLNSYRSASARKCSWPKMEIQEIVRSPLANSVPIETRDLTHLQSNSCIKSHEVIVVPDFLQEAPSEVAQSDITHLSRSNQVVECTQSLIQLHPFIVAVHL